MASCVCELVLTIPAIPAISGQVPTDSTAVCQLLRL